MKYAKTIGDTKKSSQKNRGDRKINRKFRAKKHLKLTSMIKKLDKIDRIEGMKMIM
jgi:hypothetical protein